MNKKIKVVCGLIYDDEFHARTGGNRFYHLNGEIETISDGKQVYICTRQNQQTGKFEDAIELVSNLPKCVQKYIERYTQTVTNRDSVQYIGSHTAELM
ncbi:MAG: hypothetical protein ACI4A5_05775 [Hominilimicola sp.]